MSVNAKNNVACPWCKAEITESPFDFDPYADHEHIKILKQDPDIVFCTSCNHFVKIKIIAKCIKMNLVEEKED